MFRSRNKIGQSLPDINLEVDIKAHLYSDAVAGQVDVESGVGRERVISPVAGQPGGERHSGHLQHVDSHQDTQLSLSCSRHEVR